MNLRNKRGFLISGVYHDNNGLGHESNALKIIQKNGWLDAWRENGYNAQDFIVLVKGAIQVGSGHRNEIIIVSSRFYTSSEIEGIKKKYSIHEYTVIMY